MSLYGYMGGYITPCPQENYCSYFEDLCMGGGGGEGTLPASVAKDVIVEVVSV